MTELQITSLKIIKDDLSFFDTGGAIREVNVSITVDSTLLLYRQKENLIHEILGVYLGTILSVEMLSQIAQTINEALRDLTEE